MNVCPFEEDSFSLETQAKIFIQSVRVLLCSSQYSYFPTSTMSQVRKEFLPVVAADDIPDSHKKALQFIEDVTANADQVQRRVLEEILQQNAGVEYLSRHGMSGTSAGDFKRLVPVVTYEDLQPDIHRIAQGDSSPILCGRPISEFFTSSCTTGGEVKLIPTIQEEFKRRFPTGTLSMAVMSRFMPGLDEGKGMYFLFVKPEVRTPGGLLARPVITSFLKNFQSADLPHNLFDFHTSPTEAIFCPDTYQSMYAQLLCGIAQREEVLRAGAVFASGFLHAIRFLEKHWPALCRDIRAGTADPQTVTDSSVRDVVSRVLRRPDPDLAAVVEVECGRGSWQGIITRLWPNIRYIDVIVTGSMAQYIPRLDYYSGGLPLVSLVYTSSECHFGLNLDPLCKPSEVSYTLIPTQAYFEFLPVQHSNGCATDNPDPSELVELVDVKLGQEYEIVVTTYAGLYRYRVGDVLRVAGFKNKAPRFNFVRRMNVALSIDTDKTDEADLHSAVEKAAGHLEPSGVTLVDYTSHADTSSIPGHYVLYWQLRMGAEGTPVPPSVFEDCCLTVEESLNSVYRQCRASDKSIGPLEIRIVEEGTFDKLMEDAVSRGASVTQYKTPRCVKFQPIVELLNSRVLYNFFSPRSPKWVPGYKHWNTGESA